MAASTHVTWDIVSTPHTCDWCRQIVIDIPESYRKHEEYPEEVACNFSTTLPFTIQQIVKGAEAGCPCFKWCQATLLREQPNSTGDLEALIGGLSIDAASSQQPCVKLDYSIYGSISCQPALGSTKSRSVALSVAAHPDDKVGSFMTSNRHIDREVLSPQACKMIKEWITECIGYHIPECRFEDSHFVPLRLLDVSEVSSSGILKLCEMTGQHGRRWCALSHCWGGVQPFQTTTSTYTERLTGMTLSDLPATLRDAAIVCSKLEIDYLWIDCLCIVEDDKEDVATQIAQLPSIFKYAYATIAASSAKNYGEGFLQNRSVQSSTEPFELCCRDAQGSLGKITLLKGLEVQDDLEPINHRAWTYQECLLALRLISFTSTQIRWRCGSVQRSFGGQDRRNYSPTDEFLRVKLRDYMRTNKEYAILTWNFLVMQYSGRAMAYDKDKLVAISALASEFGSARTDRYLAGLWEDDMPAALTWRAIKPSTRPAEWRAPSWSWASVQGQSAWDDTTTNVIPSAEVVHVETTPMVMALKYGEVTSGILILRGRLKEARRLPHNTEDDGSHNEGEEASLPLLQLFDTKLEWESGIFCIVCYDLVDLYNRHTAKHDQAKLVCVEIFTRGPEQTYSGVSYGLVLTENEDKTYERIGFFSTPPFDVFENRNPFDDTEYARIVIR